MGAHLIDGEFQSDKYPTTPRGKVPLSVKDPTAQDLLWEYAQRRRAVDAEFSADLEEALIRAGYAPVDMLPNNERKWLETVDVGEELPILGPKGLRAFGIGYGNLERLGFVRVQGGFSVMKITRLR